MSQRKHLPISRHQTLNGMLEVIGCKTTKVSLPAPNAIKED